MIGVTVLLKLFVFASFNFDFVSARPSFGDVPYSHVELNEILRQAPRRLPDNLPGTSLNQEEVDINSRNGIADSLFDGDINNPALTAENVHRFVRGDTISTGPKSASPGRHYTAVTSKFRLWKDGLIPYRISKDFTTDEIYIIYNAIKEIEKKSCVRFSTAKDGVIDYVMFTKGDGCWSTIGRGGFRQDVSLGDGCIRKGIIMHEIMHALGFFHEQSRHDRDSYVEVRWENILPESHIQFHKFLSPLDTETFGQPYDYDSILHYHRKAFTRNDEPTILPLTDGIRIGQRTHLSKIDIIKVNKLYGCQLDPSAFEQTLDGGGGEPSILDMFTNKKGGSVKEETKPEEENKTEKGTKVNVVDSTSRTTAPVTRSTTFTYEVCEDRISNCEILMKKRDICSEQLLKEFCVVSCGLCDEGDRPSTTTIRPTPQQQQQLQLGVSATTTVSTTTTTLATTTIDESDFGNTETSICRDHPVRPDHIDCFELAVKGACGASPMSMTGKYIRVLCKKTCKFC